MSKALKNKQLKFNESNYYLTILSTILDNTELKQKLNDDNKLSLMFNCSRIKRAITNAIQPIMTEIDKTLTDACKKDDKGMPIIKSNNGFKTYELEPQLEKEAKKHTDLLMNKEHKFELIEITKEDAIIIMNYLDGNCTDFLIENLTNK